MTSSNDFDRRLGAWLDEGPSTPPTVDRVRPRSRSRASPPARSPRRPPPRPDGRWRVRRGDAAAPAGGRPGAHPRRGARSRHGRRVLGQPSVVPPPLTATPSPSAPAPTATPTGPAVPASSPAVVRVDLIDDIGGGAFVEITDQSGTMVDARSGQQTEAGEIAGDIGVANLASDPTAVVLTWVGSPCDSRHVLTIAPDGRTVTVSRAACQGDSLAIARVLVVRFDGPVPASEVVATLETSGG